MAVQRAASDRQARSGTLSPFDTTLSLESGDYVALCVVRGPTDQPHIDLGMITPFSVA